MPANSAPSTDEFEANLGSLVRPYSSKTKQHKWLSLKRFTSVRPVRAVELLTIYHCSQLTLPLLPAPCTMGCEHP